MTDFLGIYLVGCGLLAAAGSLKLLRPGDTARAMAQLWPALGVRRAQRGVRTLAGAEAVLGVAGIVYPNAVAAALVAASYLAFVVVVSYARARGGPLATCGCFGTPDTPPTITHAAIDAVFAVGASIYAGAGSALSLPAALRHQYGDGLPLLAAVIICGWLAFLGMVRLPQLQAAQWQAAQAQAVIR